VELLGLARLADEHGVERLLHHLCSQALAVWDGHQPAVLADHRRRGDLQMEVRALGLDQVPEGIREVERHVSLIGAAPARL